jgi:hypothetical protein
MKKAQPYIDKCLKYKKIEDLGLATSSTDNGIVGLMIYEIVSNLSSDFELYEMVQQLQEVCDAHKPTLNTISKLNSEIKYYNAKIINKLEANYINVTKMSEIKKMTKEGKLNCIPKSWLESLLKLELELKSLKVKNKEYNTYKLKGVTYKGSIEVLYDKIESYILTNYRGLYDEFYDKYNIQPFSRLNKATSLVRKLGLSDGENVIELPNKNYRSYVAKDGMRFVQNPKKLNEDSWNNVTHTSDTEVIYNGSILDRHNSKVVNDINYEHYNKIVVRYLLATIVHGFNVSTIK